MVCVYVGLSWWAFCESNTAEPIGLIICSLFMLIKIFDGNWWKHMRYVVLCFYWRAEQFNRNSSNPNCYAGNMNNKYSLCISDTHTGNYMWIWTIWLVTLFWFVEVVRQPALALEWPFDFPFRIIIIQCVARPATGQVTPQQIGLNWWNDIFSCR